MSDKIIIYNIDVAVQYGEREAVIIQLFQFWISKNKANNKNFYNGHYWTYNSVEAWQELLPHYTKKQLRSTLDNLCQQGVLIKGNFNKNKFDRTCWYAFSDEKKWLSESTKNTAKRENQNDNSDLPNKENTIAQQDDSICPNGQSNTSNYTSSDTSNKQNIYTPRGEKKSWGEFGNVKLTDDEYEKLVKHYGLDDKVDFAIKVLDCYLENNPDAKSRYKSHYAAMQVGTWIYDKTEKDWFPTKPRIFDPEKDFVPAKPLITLE